MRKLFVVAAAAGALVGAGWIGMSLAAPYEPPPVPQAAATPEKQTAAKRPRVKKTWAERAGASCARALEDNRAVVRDSPYTTADSRSVLEAVLRLGKTLNWIEGRLLRELKGLRPAAADRRRVAEALELLADLHRDHLATIAGTRKGWSEQRFAQAIRRDEQMSAKLRVLFLGVGATACAAYLDPASY